MNCLRITKKATKCVIISEQRTKSNSTLGILKKRFASGKIDVEEFHRLKKTLEEL
ncbi:MAG: SHOCT domain-containing protein [Flavobacterium sp.]